MAEAIGKRVAFLNDTSAWYHWGCTGTSEAIKGEMEARGYEILSVPIHLIYECQAIPENAAEFDSPQFFNRFFHANIAVTAAILKSDIVVINGEGSLHGLSPVARVLLYLAYASKKFCGKSVQIINHSCFPDSSAVVDDSPASAVYRGVYRLLDFVAIRERHSHELLKKLGVSATLAFDCLPLYIGRHVPNGPAERSKSIVIAGSVAWRAEGILSLSSYIRRMAGEGYAVKVLTGAKERPALDDAAFVNSLRKASSGEWSLVEARSMSQWLETIGSAALLVSGRFHYTIASCMLDTPCVVLDSNTPKNRAICEEAGLAAPLAFSTAHLDRELWSRSDTALKGAGSRRDVKDEWLRRAERNFDGLPALVPAVPASPMIRVYSRDSKGATAFFRNRPLLETLSALLKDQSPKVLVQAASIGAEAYSFAVYCQLQGIRCECIQATDISEEFLQQARTARYSANLLDALTEAERGFFEKTGDVMTPIRSIRDAVSFLPAGSFVTAEFPDIYDLVFVNNALTYVTPAEQAHAIDRIARYSRNLLVVTAFHPQTIESDLRRNGYVPVTDNIEAIHNAWGDRISLQAPEGHSWMLRPFSRIDGYEYKYCAIFRKAAS